MNNLNSLIIASANLGIGADIEIKPETKLSDLNYDDLSFIELAIDVEQNYNMSISSSCIETWITVKDVYDTVGLVE